MAKKERSTLCKGIMEMVGTGILLVTAQTTSATSPEQVASAVCAVLVAIIYMGVDLSGAHYNPAVTFIFVLRERCSVPVALFYTAMQFSGGLCGAWIAKAINPKILPFRVGEGYTLAQALVGELLFTTLLCLSILTLALRNNVQLSPIFGIAIVGVIYAGICATGPVSGAAFNPVVAITAAWFNNGNLFFALLVSAVTMLAPLLATLAFYIIAPEELAAVSWGRRFAPDEEEQRGLLEGSEMGRAVVAS